MEYKIGATELTENELASDMNSLGIEPPDALEFPWGHKLNEKFYVQYDEKGLVLKDGVYVPAFSRVITKNKVVLQEKGD